MSEKESVLIDPTVAEIVGDILDKNSRNRTSQISTHVDTWESNIMTDRTLLNTMLRNKTISQGFYNTRAKQLDEELSVLWQIKNHFQKLYFPTPTDEENRISKRHYISKRLTSLLILRPTHLPDCSDHLLRL